jgi:hypothetical protein
MPWRDEDPENSVSKNSGQWIMIETSNISFNSSLFKIFNMLNFEQVAIRLTVCAHVSPPRRTKWQRTFERLEIRHKRTRWQRTQRDPTQCKQYSTLDFVLNSVLGCFEFTYLHVIRCKAIGPAYVLTNEAHETKSA